MGQVLGPRFAKYVLYNLKEARKRRKAQLRLSVDDSFLEPEAMLQTEQLPDDDGDDGQADVNRQLNQMTWRTETAGIRLLQTMKTVSSTTFPVYPTQEIFTVTVGPA